MKRFILILLFACNLLFISAQQLSTEQLDRKWIAGFGAAEKEYKERDYAASESHLQICLRLLDNNDATLSVYYFRTLSLLGEVQFGAKDKEGFAHTKEHYQSLKSGIRPCSKKMVYYLYHGAILFSSTHDYSSALSCVQEALQCSDAVSAIKGMTSKLYHQMAYCYYKTGRIDEAIENEKLAVSFDANDLPSFHKSLLHYLAVAGKWDVFEKELPRCYTSAREPILRHFSQSKASKRNQFWSVSGLFFTTFLPNYAFSHPSNKLIAYVYDATLFSKGILLEATNKSSDLIMDSGDSELIEMYQHYLALKASKERTLDQQFEIEALEDVIVRYQQEHKYDFRKDFRCDWKMVQGHLKEHEAAIEFISFPLENGELQYAALLVLPQIEAPIFTPLFTENHLNSIPCDLYCTSSKLYDFVWAPLEKSLQDVRTIYFSPSGVFHKIGIEYLPDDLGINMSMSHQMCRLSSTRELVLHRSKQPGNKAFFGGIDYNTPVSVLSNQVSTYQSTDIGDARDVSGLRGGNNNGFNFLPGTLKEVEDISAMYSESGLKPYVFVNQEASETQLKNLSDQRFSMLHIATHGFFYAPKRQQKSISITNLFDDLSIHDYSGEIEELNEDKMLTCSGLILAGGNNRLRKVEIPNGQEDGILFADELAALNFSDLDLVILSACESGLGNIASGEGVFGLQRGFKIAGTNSILMSLWKVDDQATQILMTAFHANMLAGQNKRDAFKNAQLELRFYDKNKYDTPNYWAAFVLLDGLD